MAEMELPDIAATMGAAYDAAETGTEYVQPQREEVEVTAEKPEPVEEKAETQDSDQGDANEAEPQDDSPAPIEPHPRWSAEVKAQFAALPREAQEILLQRERDVESHLTQRTQELSQQSTRYKALDELLEPRRQAFAMDGYDDVGAVRQLFALSDFAAKDPASFINWFAQQRGVDLASLQNTPDDSGDPEITALRRELAQIKGTLTQSQEQQTKAQQQQLQAQVQEFASETDDNGQPLRPHFEAVKGHMGALLQAGTAKDLADAYEQAVWANPETRKALMESQTKAAEEKRIAEAKAKAAAAQKAASTKPRASNGQFVPAADASIADTMSKVYDSMHG